MQSRLPFMTACDRKLESMFLVRLLCQASKTCFLLFFPSVCNLNMIQWRYIYDDDNDVFISSAFRPLSVHQPLSVSQEEDERGKGVTQAAPTEMAPWVKGSHPLTELPKPRPSPGLLVFTRLSQGIDTHHYSFNQIAASAVCRRDQSGGTVAAHPCVGEPLGLAQKNVINTF